MERLSSNRRGPGSRWFSAVVLAAVTAAAGVSQASQPATQPAPAGQLSQQEMMQQLQALQAEVQQLKAQQAGAANVTAAPVASLPTPAADTSAQTAMAVQADARNHSTLFDVSNPLVSGWNGKAFVLQSENGDFLLHPWVQVQVRNVTSYRQAGKNTGSDDDTSNGFEIRRAKFGFDGNLFSPDFTYLINFGANRAQGTTSVKSGATTLTINQGNGGVPVLEEAWGKYLFHGTHWGIEGGQFKDPFVRESMLSSKKLLTAERTFTTDYLTGGDNFVQGAMVTYGTKETPVHAQLAYTDGANLSNNNFQDFPAPPGAGANYGGAARGDCVIFGKYSDYDDYTALGIKEHLLVIGGGADYTEINSSSATMMTADIQYKHPCGLALYAAYIGRYTKHAGGGVGPDLYDYGAYGQASYLFPTTKFELFGRYDYFRFDKANTAVGVGFKRDVHEFTAGLNYYFVKHAAKFTLDGTYLPNGIPVSDTGADILANKKNELLLRAQLQFLVG